MRVMLDPARPESPPRHSSGRRHRRRRIAAIVLLLAVISVLVQGIPGHHQAKLLGELAASDGRAVLIGAVPLLRDPPPQPCEMLEAEYESNNHLFRDHRIGWYASIWSSYQALNALYVTSLLPGGQRCRADFEGNVRAIDAYYWDTSYRGASPAFDQGPAAIHFHSDPPRVDDSLWMALAVDRMYLMTGNRAYLRTAEAVFRMAVANWDSRKGGIFWENHADGATDPEKAIVSNGPAIVLGADLYSQTQQSSYLTWSSRILQWLEASLLDRGSGLYDDHIGDKSGPAVIDDVKLTYNQGIMVGAMAALATVDPRQYPLSRAVDLADRSMAYFRTHHAYGQPSWDAIWAQYLLWTAGLYRNETFGREARSSVDLALSADPASSGSLVDKGAEIELRELARLPANEYRELCSVTAHIG